MEPSFWRERWRINSIAFHQRDFNPYLIQYQHLLPTDGTILVPLCGKSRDMLFLAQRGNQVVGCELVETALEAFYQENGLHAQRSEEPPFIRFEAENIRTYAGDFFALTNKQTGPVAAIFDRAALVALPEAMRQQYLEHTFSFLEPGGVCLMVGLRYEGENPSGPPFSIPAQEVTERTKGFADFRFLQESDVLMGRPDLQQKGYRVYREWVALLTKK
jgi:thiopurine S-methyltransferase